MPIYRTGGENKGIGVACEIGERDLASMTAGEVFELVAGEYWREFIRMAKVPAKESLDVTYNRAFSPNLQ